MEQNYLILGLDLINNGHVKDTRTGKVRSMSGRSLSFDLQKGFPLLTTKYINIKHILYEVVWYLMGTESIDFLQSHGIHIWDDWADSNNSIGKTYGYQWRHFNDITDQVAEVKRLLKEDKYSRRIMINGWNPTQLSEMALPPCIVNLHFIVEDNKLNLVVYQRSADFCLGVPYDIAEMALITHLFADDAGLDVGTLTMFYGDIHIYENHIDNFISKQYINMQYPFPTLNMNVVKKSIKDNVLHEGILVDYKHAPTVKYKISV